VKYFFRRKFPGAADVLLIESGSPEVARRALGGMRQIFPRARYHLLTCWPDPPAGLFASIFRASDYPSAWEKVRLLVSLARRKWRVLAILCTGESVLWRWKMLALALLPAKVLIVNENADFFWLDWANRRTLRRFLAIRWGVNRDEILSTALRALVFPLTLLFLILTALYLYCRRWRRLLVWRLHPNSARTARTPKAASAWPRHAGSNPRS